MTGYDINSPAFVEHMVDVILDEAAHPQVERVHFGSFQIPLRSIAARSSHPIRLRARAIRMELRYRAMNRFFQADTQSGALLWACATCLLGWRREVYDLDLLLRHRLFAQSEPDGRGGFRLRGRKQAPRQRLQKS